jgi:TP901 family phage tail tape measure protein
MTNRTVSVALRADVRDYVQKMRAAKRSSLDLADQIKRAQKTHREGMDELATGAGIAGAALLASVGLAVKGFAQFDQQMSSVASAGKEYKASIDGLRESAVRAGMATKFSATEAAAGQEELAKAGVLAADIMGGALSGALNLAAVGNLGVADSAKVTAITLEQYGLAGGKAAHVADLLAAGSGKAMGEVSDLAGALEYVGPVAAGMNVSLEETVGTLALFAAKGIIGEKAGTSFRGMLATLSSGAGPAAREMERLGISVFDTSGEFVGMAGVADQLRTRLGHLTTEERSAALVRIFGNEQLTAARILYDGGAVAVRKWTAEVNDSGYAAETAAEKMDNLLGDWEKLTGSVETGFIQSGSGANGGLRELTQGVNGLVDAYLGLPGPVQQGAFWLTSASGAALAAMAAYGTLAPKVQVAREALDAMGPAGQKANTALGSTAKWAGRAGVALTALAVVGALFESDLEISAKAVDRLAGSLRDLAATGELSGKATEILGTNMRTFQEDVHALEQTGMGKLRRDVAALAGSITGLADSEKRLEATDAALAQLAESGHAAEAQRAFARMAEAAKAQGISLDELKAGMPGYVDVISAAGEASGHAAGATGALAKRSGELEQFATDAAAAVKEFAEELGLLNGGNISADRSAVAFSQSLKEMKESLGTSAGATSLVAGKAGEARLAFIDAAEAASRNAGAIAEQTGSADAGAAALARSRAALIAAAVAAGMNRTAAVKLADAYLSLPAKASTTTTAPGLADALAGARSLSRELDRLNGRTVTTFVKSITSGKPSPKQDPTLGGVLKPKVNADGGMYYHAAATGALREAELAGPGTRYQWAEPVTGGEAFIPRLGDKRRSRGIATAVVEQWLGGQVVWPMAKGGMTAMAAGGASVPLGDFMSRYTPSSYSTKTDVTAAHRARSNAADAVRIAEQRLRADRARGVGASKIAQDEAALARTRRALATATEKLGRAQASYRASMQSPGERFRKALGAGVKSTGAFLANLQKLADLGYRDLAMQLLNMGGPEAEAIAASAVAMSRSSLRGIAGNLSAAGKQQAQLQYFGEISAARASVKKGQSSFAALMGSTGSSGDDLAAALKLITAELRKSKAGRALLADMVDHGYAAGGIAPPGTRYRYAEPSTGGEALVPRFGDSARARSILSTAAGWYGMQVGSVGSTGSTMQAPSVTNVRVFVGDREIKDIVRTEVSSSNRRTEQEVLRGRRS